MKFREFHRLAAALEKQGARVRRTKSGYQVCTDKGVFGFHLTPSDQRAERNLRADVVRVGLDWPLK